MIENKSNWLNRFKEDLVTISSDAAREYWPGPTINSPPYFNYRLEHVKQVERDAVQLLEQVDGDSEIVLASVWIHDRFQPQFTGENHAARAADWARANLIDYGFPPEKLEKVYFALAHHSDKPGSIPPEAREARILWDADKLTKLGPFNIISFLCSIPAFPSQEITLTRIAEQGLEQLEKVKSLIDKFYFDVSHIRALDKYKVQKAFYDSLIQEVGI